jgi:hypothetical protein
MVRAGTAALILAALGVAALLWLASEQHYQGCVSAAAARTAEPTGDVLEENNPFNGPSRAVAVRGCSRLPW